MKFLLATSNNFNVEYFNKYVEYQKENNSNVEAASGVLNSFHGLIPLAINITFYFFMICFAISVVILAVAMITKHAQWLQTSVRGIIGTIVAILLLRLVPLLFLTNDIEGIASLMRDSVDFLTTIGIHSAIGMLLIGLFLKMLYRIFEHPKYFKWSKSLKIGSALILILSIVSPLIIGNI